MYITDILSAGTKISLLTIFSRDFLRYISLYESVEANSIKLSWNINFIELNRVSTFEEELVRNFTFSSNIANWRLFSFAMVVKESSFISG